MNIYARAAERDVDVYRGAIEALGRKFIGREAFRCLSKADHELSVFDMDFVFLAEIEASAFEP